MKGIILAGGHGSRLYPATKVISKQLLPVYNKPMIYYPISTLMLAGIREILIITSPHDKQLFHALLGDGHQLGIHFDYATQERPQGLADAFIVGEKFIGQDNVCLILGDNIYYGQGFSTQLEEAAKLNSGALAFAHYVNDPERYGIVTFDSNMKITSIEEKPTFPKSNYAITGLYFYDNNVINYAKTLIHSPRGELEITDINKIYLAQNKLQLRLMGRGLAWLDTGTFDSLNDANNFVKTIESGQGLKVSCLEEIAYKKGYISREQLDEIIKSMPRNEYSLYLKKISERQN